jgi:RNA polymerase sigma-70 factor, ECF subfamily
MTTPESELNLIPRINHDQFVALLVRHDRRLRSFIATMLGNLHDIEEAVQNTSLVAWRKIQSFTYTEETPDEEFVRWLCTIARYEVLTLRKSPASHLLVFEDRLLERIAAVNSEQSSDLEHRYQALVQCIQRLRPRDRKMAHRFYEANSTAQELATKFGIGVQAVYKSLSRIRANLMECIRRTMQREGSL